MFAKFAEATRLLFTNLRLFSSIILTIWLPGNILSYLVFHVLGTGSVVGPIYSRAWISVIFGPLCTGAMIHLLSQLKQGQLPKYSVALANGLRSWERLFAAHFLAGIFLIIGFYAFVLPAFILLVRYALLAPVVVLEGVRGWDAPKRSAERTVGIRWQIFLAGLLYTMVIGCVSGVVLSPLVLLPRLVAIVAEVTLICVLDVVGAIFTIVMFLYYWQAYHHTSEDDPIPIARPASGRSVYPT
jgi:hypothetical protein